MPVSEVLRNVKVKFDMETNGLDETVEKMNRLVELLREAQQIADSFARR